MIPYLYESTETEFTSNGIGRLVDALDCKVTEERNGQYELFLSYPIDGAYFSEITKDRIIAAVPAQGKRIQPFRIYRITKPLNGICSIYAEHISYELNHIPVMPFNAGSCQAALNGLKTNSAQENPFNVWTDKTTPGAYTLAYPMPFRALLGGTQGSLLDVYGTGEYEFDRYLVRLWVNRGYDTGVTIRYGKNLTGLEHDENLSNTITGIVPYWYSMETGNLVTLPEKAIWADTAALYPYKRTAVKDFSSDFEEQPTVDQLRARANKYITDNDIGKPSISIKIEFVPLDQVDGVSLGAPTRTLVFPATVSNGTLYTTGTVSGDTANFSGAYFEVERADYNVLEHVNLCDTVTVQYMDLGVSATAEVIKTEWNVLKDRYNSIEVGNPRSTLASTITGIEDSMTTRNNLLREAIGNSSSALRDLVYHQTDLITGGLGGYIVFNFNAAGEPQEFLVMDTPNVSTAVNVIRINQAGIGFSTNGYDGPYTSAWTIDGVFNADFIRAGTLIADIIKAGILSDEAGKNSWDLTSGDLSLQGDIVMTDGEGRYATLGEVIYHYLANFSSGSGGYDYSEQTGIGFAAKYGENISSPDMQTGFAVDGTSGTTYFAEIGTGNTANMISHKREYQTRYSGVDMHMEEVLSNGFLWRVFNLPNNEMTQSMDLTADGLSLSVQQAISTGYVSLLTYFRLSRSRFQWLGDDATADVRAQSISLGAKTTGGDNAYILVQGPLSSSSSAFFNVHASDNMYLSGYLSSTSVAYLLFCGQQVQMQSSSSARYKRDISELSGDRDPHKLLELNVVEFRYKADAKLQYGDMAGKTIPGIIAEDVADKYPSAVIHNADGEAESWDERRILPGMLALIQEQQKRLDEQEERIKSLETKVAALMEVINSGTK